MNSAIMALKFLYVKLRLDCIFNCIAKLNLIVMVLQDLFNFECVLVPAECLQ